MEAPQQSAPQSQIDQFQAMIQKSPFERNLMESPWLSAGALEIKVIDSEFYQHMASFHTSFSLYLKQETFTWNITKHLRHIIQLRSDISDIESEMDKHTKLVSIRKLLSSNKSVRVNALQKFFDKIARAEHLLNALSVQIFLEVSPFSFIDAYGPKGKEGYLERKVEAYNPGILSRKHRRWFVLKEGFIVHLSYPDFESSCAKVILFDTGSTISDTGGESRSGIALESLSYRIEIKGNPRKISDWKLALSRSIRESPFTRKHPFDSYAPVRQKNSVDWLVEGKDYMESLITAIESAKEEIMIANWWLHPTLFLKRPAKFDNLRYRLDMMLSAKASQGVKIYILVYKEIKFALPHNRFFVDYTRTKKKCKMRIKISKSIGENIIVLRHPDHPAHGVFFWAHHEKIVCIDQKVAYVGGIDLALGRYDTSQHKIFDDRAKENQLFPGKDFYNPRMNDVNEVELWEEDINDREKIVRLPWHDVHCKIEGQSARDLSRHFIQRWNHVKYTKYKSNPRIPYLLPKRDLLGHELDLIQNASCDVQIIRSAAKWSAGISKPEESFLNAYIHLIESAENYIYIENQFFISSLASDNITNAVSDALFRRIEKAMKNHSIFRVYIILPLLPAFGGVIGPSMSTSLRAVMHWQYQSLCRGESSLIERLKRLDLGDVSDYVSICGLRTYQKHETQLATEMVYVHSKVMIADDRYVIIGSANINDRSLVQSTRDGHDSECGAYIHDTKLVHSQMNGKKFEASHFAISLRMRLMAEHLGMGADELQKLRDPVCENFYRNIWCSTAEKNTVVYRTVFRCLPDDSVHNYSQIPIFSKRIPGEFQFIARSVGANRLDDDVLGESADKMEEHIKILSDDICTLRIQQDILKIKASILEKSIEKAVNHPGGQQSMKEMLDKSIPLRSRLDKELASLESHESTKSVPEIKRDSQKDADEDLESIKKLVERSLCPDSCRGAVGANSDVQHQKDGNKREDLSQTTRQSSSHSKPRYPNRAGGVPSPKPGLSSGQHYLQSLGSFRQAFSSKSRLNIFETPDEIQTASKEEYEPSDLEFDSILQKFQYSIPTSPHSRFDKVYTSSFLGSDAVSWMKNSLKLSDGVARRLCQKIMDEGVFSAATKSRGPFVHTELYVFQDKHIREMRDRENLLGTVKGHLVTFPTEFLRDQTLWQGGLTLDVFIPETMFQ